jgi:hypothetical protein
MRWDYLMASAIFGVFADSVRDYDIDARGNNDKYSVICDRYIGALMKFRVVGSGAWGCA